MDRRRYDYSFMVSISDIPALSYGRHDTGLHLIPSLLNMKLLVGRQWKKVSIDNKAVKMFNYILRVIRTGENENWTCRDFNVVITKIVRFATR